MLINIEQDLSVHFTEMSRMCKPYRKRQQVDLITISIYVEDVKRLTNFLINACKRQMCPNHD